MNSYAIGSDSPRWWWPSAAAGVAGAAAVAAILVLPTTGSTLPHGTTPQDPPAPALHRDPWVTTTDPGMGRQCFALPPRWNAGLEHSPSCGHRAVTQHPGKDAVRRPGLDARP
jgi:hypothetical protein